jgi:hypothetical protein
VKIEFDIGCSTNHFEININRLTKVVCDKSDCYIYSKFYSSSKFTDHLGVLANLLLILPGLIIQRDLKKGVVSKCKSCWQTHKKSGKYGKSCESHDPISGLMLET